MRRIIVVFLMLAGIALLSVDFVYACGDKALRIGRGIRFRRPSPPSAVLIYIPSNVTRGTQLESLLRKIGHKTYVASGSNDFSVALTSGNYDLLFTDVASAPSIEKQMQSSSSKLILIPVVANGKKAEVEAVQKQYRYIVKKPHSGEHYLDVIDEAMRSRVRLIAKKA